MGGSIAIQCILVPTTHQLGTQVQVRARARTGGGKNSSGPHFLTSLLNVFTCCLLLPHPGRKAQFFTEQIFFFFDFWASYTRLCAHFGGPHALPICCVPRSIWGRGKPSTGFKWWNFAVQTCCTCSGGPLQSLHSSVFLDFGF